MIDSHSSSNALVSTFGRIARNHLDRVLPGAFAACISPTRGAGSSRVGRARGLFDEDESSVLCHCHLSPSRVWLN